MPRGPNGERRPADTVSAAIMVAKLSVGDIEEELPAKQSKPREVTLTEEERSERARKAANARWAKQEDA